MQREKITKMWKKLFEYKIVRITKMKYDKGYLHFSYVNMEDHTFVFETVIVGYNQLMLLYEEMIKNDPFNDVKIELLGQSGLILLITTLESYLGRAFYNLCRRFRVRDLEENKFKKFLKNFDVRIKHIHNEIADIKLSNFLSEKISFQNKNMVKKAYSLFDFKIAEINPKLWEKIFAGENSYMQIRHGLIHEGPEYGLYKINRININQFEEIMVDLAKFLCLVDDKLYDRFKEMI